MKSTPSRQPAGKLMLVPFRAAGDSVPSVLSHRLEFPIPLPTHVVWQGLTRSLWTVRRSCGSQGKRSRCAPVACFRAPVTADRGSGWEIWTDFFLKVVACSFIFFPPERYLAFDLFVI